MVELYPVGQIFDNHVYPGVLHNAFIDVGIPSIAPEIGAARVLELEMIALFVEGTMNVLKHHGILAGPMGRTGKDMDVFVGNSAFPVLATAGGLVEHLVKLNDKVEAGQKVAIQRNSFGEVVAEYTSGVAGEITGSAATQCPSPATPWYSSFSTSRRRRALRFIPSEFTRASKLFSFPRDLLTPYRDGSKNLFADRVSLPMLVRLLL